MDDRGCWDLALDQLGFDALPHESALPRDEVGTEHRRDNNDSECRPDSDPGPEVVEQGDLDNRHDDKSNEEPGSQAHTENVVRMTWYDR